MIETQDASRESTRSVPPPPLPRQPATFFSWKDAQTHLLPIVRALPLAAAAPGGTASAPALAHGTDVILL